MFKKFFVGLVALAATAYFIHLIVYGVVSHETRIRWLLNDTAKEFNDGDALGIGGNLAEDFVEETTRLNRQQVIAFLLRFFQMERRGDGTFPYYAEVLEFDSPQSDGFIRVKTTEPLTAEVRVHVLFYEVPNTSGENRPKKSLAVVEFTGEFILEDGRWRILRAKRKVIEGRTPF